MENKNLRIHGDNIVECERALSMIVEAFDGKLKLKTCPVYKPIYEISSSEVILTVELLSGHGRWNVNMGKELSKNGGILREGADSYISEIKDGKEHIRVAIEYCSALPAGNNAWQRNGRALSSIIAGVPYLYMAELGGVELDENRNVKAARYPNPIVPFSYLCVTKDYGHLCAPVYRPHPSISNAIYKKFEEVFGYDECLKVIYGTIMGIDISAPTSALVNKTLQLVRILSADKKGNNILQGEDWYKLLISKNRGEWLVSQSKLIWKKKTSSKVKSTQQFKSLLSDAVAMNLKTIGASDIPICLIPKNRIADFNKYLDKQYPALNIQLPIDKTLAVVWITGYKPSGDDSRPDRGLCPLTKMVLGNSCHIMSIVYGPGTRYTWDALHEDIAKLAQNNGLWEAIYNISDLVVADSTEAKTPMFIAIKQARVKHRKYLEFDYKCEGTIEYSEHDTDTAIHQILANSGLDECLCNPPGGDWSGISYFTGNEIIRWTSLPRVSKVGGKRPDHVFQSRNGKNNLLITIESKGKGVDLEDKIGINLKAYLKDLFALAPTSHKVDKGEWRLYNNTTDLGCYEIVSVGAFIYKNDEELSTHMERGKLDAIMAFEFSTTTTLHLLFNEKGRLVKDFVEKALGRMGGFKIKIH